MTQHPYLCFVICTMTWVFCVSPGIPQDASLFRPPQSSLKGSGRSAGRISNRQRGAEQLENSLDEGDSYATPGGKHHLFRLAGSVAIRFKPQVQKPDELTLLTAAGGPLESYTVELEFGNEVFVLKAPPSQRQQQRRQPSRLREAIAKARATPTVQSAYPVFVEPENALARLPTAEILIHLKPQVDPQTYFGEVWARVRRLGGTREQFILTLPLATAEELLAEVDHHASDSRVAWAEPNFLSQVIKESSDSLFLQQWTLNNRGLNGSTAEADVKALGAWTNSIGNAGIVIAMLDDGIQLDHPDLRANIFSNPGESRNGLDDDANGYVDDLHGWNFSGDNNDPSPEAPNDNHGTATAGVAAAAGNNQTGVTGIAYGCQIMPLKVTGGENWALDSTLAEALHYAAGRTRDGLGTWRGADVISISLTFPPSSVVDSALLWASTNGRGGKGCPIFAAAGDDASRWRPTRIRLPVGAREGPGSYQFGFEYSKDVSSSQGEDLVKIDNVALLASDGVTQLDSPIGSSGRQDFEDVFPPPGWQLSASFGAPLWTTTTTGALTGTHGSISAQSGFLADNQWTEMRTPVVTLSGAEILSFSCYISSEADYDGLRIWVYDGNGNYLDVFEGPLSAPLLTGNPGLTNAIHYPASHPDTIAVGASTDCDLRSDYSQSGTGLEFLAPSSGGWNDVITTDRTGRSGVAEGDYLYDFGGTSAACPLAAGIGALVLSINPSLTAAEVRTTLRHSCEKIGGVAYDASGWNPFYGYGRLNAKRAVDDVKASAVVDLKLALSPLADPVNTGDPLTYVLSISNQGPALATGVVLTNILPDHVQFVSSSPPASLLPSSSVLVFDLGDLWVGAVTNVTIVVAPVAAGTITEIATVTSTTTETDPADNQVSATTSVVVPFRVVIASPANNSAVLDPANLVVTALATDPGGAITKVEFFAGAAKIGEATNAPYVITWRSPPHGHYSLSARLTDNHGETRHSAAITLDVVPALRIGDVTVVEGNRGALNAVFIVRLSSPSLQSVTVDYATADGTALAGKDYARTNGTVVFPPGTLTRLIPVPVFGNSLSQSNRSFLVNLSNPFNAGLADGQGLGAIVDNDLPPALFINDVTVMEGDSGTTNAIFTVRLSAPSGKTVTVNYRTANGTALGNLDFVPASGTLSFPPGTTNQALAVAVMGDTLSENTETFLVVLNGPVNATIGDGQGVGTILDNDPGPSLTIHDATLTEGNRGFTNAVFSVSLSGPSGKTITVNYSTANGTALGGRDFVPRGGTLIFAPGTTNQGISVAVIGNTMSESNNTFLVNLTNAVNATIADGQGRGAILDDDPVPALTISDATVVEGNRGALNAVFVVRLSTRSGRPISVDYATADGTALAGKDYVGTNGTLAFPPGIIAQSLWVAVIGNTLSQSNRSFLVNLSHPVNAGLADGQGLGAIVDTDPAPALFINDTMVKEGDTGTTNAIFTVRLSAPSGKTVTVNYHTANGTALGNLDFVPANGTLSFPPGVTNQTLAVAVLGDTLCENTETFLVNLSSPINATIADGQGVGAILDNDFKITAARIVGTNVLISFTTLTGRTCRAEFADRLAGISNIWQPVPGAASIWGRGSVATATNLGGAGWSNRFYRIRMLP